MGAWRCEGSSTSKTLILLWFTVGALQHTCKNTHPTPIMQECPFTHTPTHSHTSCLYTHTHTLSHTALAHCTAAAHTSCFYTHTHTQSCFYTHTLTHRISTLYRSSTHTHTQTHTHTRCCTHHVLCRPFYRMQGGLPLKSRLHVEPLTLS